MGKRLDFVWSLRTATVSTPLKRNEGTSGLVRPRAESSVDGSEAFCGPSHHLFCGGGKIAHWGDSAHHCWIEDEARKLFHVCFLRYQTRHNWKWGGESSTTESNIRQWGTFHSDSLLTSPSDPFFYECKQRWLCSHGFSLQKKLQPRTLILNFPVQYTSQSTERKLPQTPN